MPTKVKPEPNYDPRIDAYINKSKPFAQPILHHLRELIHKAVPDIQESIKWSRPFFEHKGVILGNISAFSAHCTLGFWGQEMTAILREAGILDDSAMGSLGRITSLQDLPPDKQLLTFIRQAAASIEAGTQISPIASRNKVAKPETPKTDAPTDLTQALKTNKAASKVFANFSPSAQREYIEWITEAKRQETRQKRLTQSIEWIAEGKQRHWKYQNC